jgi:hypothetical protein
MLTLLHLADKDVRQALFDAVLGVAGLAVVALVRHEPGMSALQDREPFATLERRHGRRLHLVAVLDEGKVEGMWRDPVGDLAEKLYPQDRAQASLAAHNYFVLKDGAPLGVVKKHSSAAEDARALEALLQQVTHGGSGGGSASSGPAPGGTSGTPSGAPAAKPDGGGPHVERDPFEVLGIARTSSLSDARRAFRQLVAQYHPDKVAHLAEEFRSLAEERTRALTAAWEAVQDVLKDR